MSWKMFLPQKWKDSNISRQPALINMDPNLTLAHVTHNTSMILLHQRIAYPQLEWARIVQLPSTCSAETCQVAAVETANITEKYLRYTPTNSPVNSQFTFCVFMSARVLLGEALSDIFLFLALTRDLLVHWRYYNSDLIPEFWALVESLERMASRWIGPTLPEDRRWSCLAGKYALELRELHKSCVSDPEFKVDVLGYSTSTSNHTEKPCLKVTRHSPGLCRQGPAPATPQQPGPELHLQPNAAMLPMQVAGFSPRSAETGDELSAISHMLLDQRFMDMDRVISFDDMVFTTNVATPSIGFEGWIPGPIQS